MMHQISCDTITMNKGLFFERTIAFLNVVYTGQCSEQQFPTVLSLIYLSSCGELANFLLGSFESNHRTQDRILFRSEDN